MLPQWLGCLIAFVYGTVVGSFLNVCIYRLPEEQSIVTPPSHCPKCDTKLKWGDLVPLFSFLFLGRKCRYCNTPISWRYFTVELITGLLFVATYLVCGGFSIDFFAYVLFISAMLIAFFVDLDRLIIPDQVVIFGLGIGIARDVAHIIAGDAKLLSLSFGAAKSGFPMLPSIAGAVVCGGAFYLVAYLAYFVFRPKPETAGEVPEEDVQGGGFHLWLAVLLALLLAPVLLFVAVVLGPMWGPIYVIGLIAYIACFALNAGAAQTASESGGEDYEGAIGGGDVNLALAIGAVLGMGPAFMSFFVAILLGATVGLAIIILRALAEKKGVPWRAEIPFGPHMVAGAVIVLLASPVLVQIWETWVRLITPG